MRLSTSTITAGSLLASIMSASAADMPVKAPPIVAPLVFSWTGFYVGGHVGAAWGDSDFESVTDAIFPGFLIGAPLILIPSRFGTVPAVATSDTSVLGGVQAGFNWQAGQFLLGIEGDVSGTQLRQAATFPVFAAPGFEAGQTLTGTYTTEIDWLASLRLRAGLVWDRLLIYATGGAAYIDANVTSSFTLTNANPGILVPAVGASGTTFASTSVSDIGWTIGGGLEWAFSHNWSFGAEYRHSDFGSHTIALASTDPSGLLGLPALTTRVDLTVDQATLRVNYRFGGR